MARRRALATAAVGALLLGGVACGSDDDAGEEDPLSPGDTTGMTTGEGGDTTGDGLEDEVEEPEGG